jgi:DNA polymerase/3'-5' exonuclease PolX
LLQIIIYNPVFSQGKVILKELLKELPSGLLDLLRVSGVVPKKVKLPYEKFKI